MCACVRIRVYMCVYVCRCVCVCVCVYTCVYTCVYLGFVFLVAVMFVSADVIHQVSLLILLFVTVVCVLQEVERLQNVARTPGDTHTHTHTGV